MPEYVERELAQFGHPLPVKPQHQPHQHTIPTYRAIVQYAKPEDTSRQIFSTKKKFIPEVIGVFLYYGSAIDSSMITALSAIASTQAASTKETMAHCKQFLNYVATHQDAILTYKRSDMPHTSANPKHAAEWAYISSYPQTLKTQSTTGLF
jgi:hypothetical protein